LPVRPSINAQISGEEKDASMDPTTTVRSDVLPGVGSLLIPGTVAAAPWIALAWGDPHPLKKFVDANQAIATVSGVFLIVAVGLLIESIGTFVESRVVDRATTNADVTERWYKYLKIAWVREPIGQRYLRRTLAMFKFELNLLVAAAPTTVGILVLAYYRVLPRNVATGGVLLLTVLGVYLCWAVRSDADLLHHLRGTLLEVAHEQEADRVQTVGSKAR
jgi:hypothetical protein